MKKLICMLLALMMVLTMAVSFASCGGDEEKKEVTVPDGYVMYENGDIRLAPPEGWEKSTDDMVMDKNQFRNVCSVIPHQKRHFQSHDSVFRSKNQHKHSRLNYCQSWQIRNFSQEKSSTTQYFLALCMKL